MNSPTNRLYESRDEALAAGVPEGDIVELDASQVVIVTKGPFKGRQYVRTAKGNLRRVDAGRKR